MRIERFDAAASPVGGGAPATRAQVDFYAPNAPALVVFQYAPDGSLVTPDGVEAEKLPGSPGFYRVTVPPLLHLFPIALRMNYVWQ